MDSIARVNYEYFGEVVSFDATHNTNQYGLIFVPFIGINHHWQSIFLGCGFIPNEGAKSFIWLFEKWLEVMGRPPSGMVTDQDLGICTAIKSVFPHIRHRFCIWHILDKLPARLGVWAFREEFVNPFKENIWGADNSQEFEAQWDTIVKKFGLENNEWLMEIYNIRKKWAPVYHKQHFWAGMSSSQRSEGMNALLKMHVSKKNSLHDFVIIFERALTRQREEELIEDHQSLEKKPKLKTMWPMEKQMCQIYTRCIFYSFQVELEHSLMYNIVLAKDDENVTYYQVNYCGVEENRKHVKYCKSEKMASCSCFMFEFKGIPCRHLLAYLRHTNHVELPKQYILTRWKRDVKRRGVVFRDGNIVGDEKNKNFASRFSELTSLANEVVDEGLFSNDAYKYARNNLHATIRELRSMKFKDSEENGEDMQNKEKAKELFEVNVHDPNQAKTKGRPRGGRWKPMREMRKVRARKCNLCGMRGQNHDSRNCPLKLTR